MSEAKLTSAIVRFTAEGWHNWLGAPEGRRYLSHSHRHLFHIEVSVQVFSDDREIEFHDLLDFCKTHWPGLMQKDLGGQSCEMLAANLLDTVVCHYPKRFVKVSVFEDGEVGAEVSCVRWEGDH